MKITRVPGKGGENLKKTLQNIKNTTGSVGWYPSAKYEAVQSKKEGGKSRGPIPVAAVAVYNEFGPYKRPFMRPTISEKQGSWKQLSLSGAKAIVAGNATGDQVLEGLLMAAEGDIRKKITSIQSPPLAESTIKARLRKRADGKTVGSLTKPLRDSGTMLDNLTHTLDRK